MQGPSLVKHIRDILILPFTVTVIIPYLVYRKGQPLFPGHFACTLAGSLLLLAGLGLFSWTVYLFWRFGRGTLAPWTATQQLIFRGPYRYCRNPMISAVFFILLGQTLLFNSRNILVVAILFFIINTVYFIWKEEPDLKKRFGDEYEDYRNKVPRWIPRPRPYRKTP